MQVVEVDELSLVEELNARDKAKDKTELFEID
jgi:hypothetical protein